MRSARFLTSPSVISALPSCCLRHRQCESPRVRSTRVPVPDSQRRADVRSDPPVGVERVRTSGNVRHISTMSRPPEKVRTSTFRSNWRTVATVRHPANRSLRRAMNSSTDSAGRPVISSTVAVMRSYRFSRCSRAMVAMCSSTYGPSLARASTCSAHVSHGTST